MRRTSILVFTGAACLAALSAFPQAAAANKSNKGSNGITLVEAKVFDERTLTPMLQALDAQIAGLRFYNAETLGQAIGRLQGVTVSRSGVAGQITTTPTPAV